MNEPTQDQLTLLWLVREFKSGTNWYRLGRVAISRISGPGALTETLRSLIDKGWVQEQETDDPAMPDLRLTMRGIEILARHEEEAP